MLFARAPEPGQVKTRLGLPSAAAAALHLAFVDDVCRLSRGLAGARTLAVAGDVRHPALLALAAREAACGHVLAIEPQAPGDLGGRMHQAIERALAAGAARVAIVGTDLPALPPAALAEALALLGTVDAVLGPADDGGYWLVGARRPLPFLFTAMPWGSPGVLAESLARLASHGTRHALAAPHFDVDRPADLERLRALLRADPSLAPATRAALLRLGGAGAVTG